MRDDDARIHSRGRNRDCRARAASRRAAFDKWWAAAETRRQFFEASDSEVEAAFHAGWLSAVIVAVAAAAEAGDESMDGLHSRNEG